jgi:acyl carrier protein
MDEYAMRGRILALSGEWAPEPRDAVLPSDRFVEDLGYDSLSVMALLTEILDEFDLDLPDLTSLEDLERAETVGQLADAVTRQVQQAQWGTGEK